MENKKGNFIKQLPGTLYYITDRDLLIEEKDGVFKFLVEKNNSGEWLLSSKNCR